MQPDKGHGNLLQKLSSMNINTLEEDQVEDIAEKIESGRRDEELPQLTIYTLEEVTVRTFIRKLVEGEKFQNWDTQEASLVFKM
jgi:type III secretory pathway component EscV